MVEHTTEQPTAFIEGLISVRSVLDTSSRHIFRIICSRDLPSRIVDPIFRAAKQKEILLEYKQREEIDLIAQGSTHGGVIAEVGPRSTVSLEQLILPNQNGWVAMVDGVEDPYNFGASVRSLYAAGVHGLVLRPRNWMSAAAVVARSSAGTSERIPTAICDTAEDAAEYFGGLGFAIACAADHGETTSIYEADLRQPLFLLVGGEKRGITRAFLRKSTLRLRIPYGRPCDLSLGTVSAAAVIAFEIARQRAAANPITSNKTRKLNQ